MYGFDLGLVVEHITGSNYKVFCNYCGLAIGTMTFEQVRTAVFGTIGRGGVRCPPCRKSTCDVCGTLCRDREELSIEAINGRSVRACPVCVTSIQRLKDELEQAISNPRLSLNVEELNIVEDDELEL